MSGGAWGDSLQLGSDAAPINNLLILPDRISKGTLAGGAVADKILLPATGPALIKGTRQVVQSLYSETYANATLAGTVFSASNTPVLFSQGDNIFAIPLTPINANSEVEVEAFIQFGAPQLCYVAASIYKDTGPNALATSMQIVRTASDLYNIHVLKRFVPGSLTTMTFNIRIATHSGNLYLNSQNTTPFLGGLINSWVKVTETLPVS